MKSNVRSVSSFRQIPVSLHKLVSDKLAGIIRGKEPDVVTGMCLTF